MFPEYLLGEVCAATATGADAECFSQLMETIGAVGGCPADLFIGNGFADADVHVGISCFTKVGAI